MSMTEMQIRRTEIVINGAIYSYGVGMARFMKELGEVGSLFTESVDGSAAKAANFFAWNADQMTEASAKASFAAEAKLVLSQDPNAFLDWVVSHLRSETGSNRIGSQAVAAQAKIKFLIELLEVQKQR